MPIIDYHCHLPPADIAGDHGFRNLAHAWAGADHRQWRAMRANGVPESEITGCASPITRPSRVGENRPGADR